MSGKTSRNTKSVMRPKVIEEMKKLMNLWIEDQTVKKIKNNLSHMQ